MYALEVEVLAAALVTTVINVVGGKERIWFSSVQRPGGSQGTAHGHGGKLSRFLGGIHLDPCFLVSWLLYQGIHIVTVVYKEQVSSALTGI